MQTRPQPDQALTDEAVVKLVLEGQGAMFEVLMRRHNQRRSVVVREVMGQVGETPPR